MPLTEPQSLQNLPSARLLRAFFNRAMARWKIDRLARQAVFLAQVGHEPGQLRNSASVMLFTAGVWAMAWRPRATAIASVAAA